MLNSYFYCHNNFLNKQKLLTNTALKWFSPRLNFWGKHNSDTNTTSLDGNQLAGLLLWHTSRLLKAALSPDSMTGYLQQANTYSNSHFTLFLLSLDFLYSVYTSCMVTLTHAETRFQVNLPWSPQWLWASSPSLTLRIAPTLPVAFR